jgi:membrane-associated phospholipid phosphatase
VNCIRSSAVCVVCVTCLGVTAPAFGQVQAPPAVESHSLAGLFKSTLNDFRRLPSQESLTWLTIGATVAATGHMKDRDVTNGFSASRMGGMFGAGEMIGGARVQMAGALATYAVGRVTGRGRVASVGGDLIRAQVLAQAMTAGIKLSAKRNRPDGGEFSFPSGHTSVTFATATVVQRHFGWKAGIPAYALASYVAASRVQVKRHFLSDVAFGAVVGVVAGRTVTVGRGRARFALSPAMSPNHAGVSFVLLDKH